MSAAGHGRYRRAARLAPALPFAVSALLAWGIAALAVASAPVQRAAHAWQDRAAFVTAPRADLDGVVVIDVDEVSLQVLAGQLGSWPYDRRVFALVNDFLARAGARRLVYDVLFTDERPGDGEFAAALKRGPPAYLAATVARLERSTATDAAPRWQSVALPVASLAAAARVGVITVLPDADGTLRRWPLAHVVGGRALPSLPYALAQDEGRASPPHDAAGNAHLRVPRNREDLAVVPFYRVVLAALGDQAAGAPGELFAGRIVFVGSSATVLGDDVTLPGHGTMPGLYALALGQVALANGWVVTPVPAATWALSGLVLLVLWWAYRASARSALPYLVASLAAAASALLLPVAAHALAGVSFDGVQPALAALASLVPIGWYRIQSLQLERRRIALERDAAAERARQKSRFLAHMSHELRTPLTAILGYHRMLAADEIPSAAVPETLAVIRRNAEQLLVLINNVLDQSKLEAGQMRLETRPTPLRPLLDDLRLLLAPLATTKGLRFEVAVDDGVPDLLALDALRLRQILVNLAGNAIKFTVKGVVRIEARWAGGRLRVAVRDTGPGIPLGFAARLFEPFEQARGEARDGGTGLGLSISRSLARLMDGEVMLERTTEAGTTFVVEIAAPVATPDVDAGSRHVLVADDNADLRALFTAYLERAGHRVDAVVDGVEAVERALAINPDVLVIDVQMPRKDGLAAVRELRAAGFAAPVIALTAQSQRDQQTETLAAGCDACLVKPVSAAELDAAVRGAMRRMP